MDVFSIAASGMHAAQAQMSAAANNIANENTPGYKTQSVDLVNVAAGGVAVAGIVQNNQPVDPIAEIVKLKQAAIMYDANAMVVTVASQMYGSLLNILDTQNRYADWDNR
jgi:flagellar basal body rod protein FlgG